LIADALGDNADAFNVVQYVWEEAFQPHDCFYDPTNRLPDEEAYVAAREMADDAGTRLGNELSKQLGVSYEERVHFIGHSLGTAVNAWALKRFLEVTPGVKAAQFTALDRPHHVHKICEITEQEESNVNFNSDFFACTLPHDREDLALRLDNYYALGGAGVGDVANGENVYNHPDLINPNDVGGEYFPEEGHGGLIDNNHSGIQQ